MDSGNSSSLQSSSGGDEEYDSSINRPDSLLNSQANVFFHSGGSNLTNSLSSSSKQLHPSSPLLTHQNHLRPTSCSLPSSSPYHAFSQPNFNPSSLPIDSYTLNKPFVQYPDLGNASALGTGGAHQVPDMSSGSIKGQTTLSEEHRPGKNPKKRTRASRRAPTTVLTTDTSNFRAMVQEYTGIPSPPFSSSFGRSRIDLLGSDSLGSSIVKPSARHFDPRSYIHGSLLRPTPQKFISTIPTMDSPSSFGYQVGSSLDHILVSQKQNHPEMMAHQLLSAQSILGLDPIPSNHLLQPSARSPLSYQPSSLGHELPIWKGTLESLQHNVKELGDHRILQVDSTNKFNHSAGPPADDSHHDKSLENAGVPTRSQATFDPLDFSH